MTNLAVFFVLDTYKDSSIFLIKKLKYFLFYLNLSPNMINLLRQLNLTFKVLETKFKYKFLKELLFYLMKYSMFLLY